VRPFGKLDLGDQYGFDPLTPFHDRRRDARSPAAFGLFRQVDKRAGRSFKLLQLCVNARQDAALLRDPRTAKT
jgi:hypothetical protein